MYCSTSVSGHLIRGALAIAAISSAIALTPHFWPALLLFPVAIYLMRGCPMCWLVGLLEAMRNRPSLQNASASKP